MSNIGTHLDRLADEGAWLCVRALEKEGLRADHPEKLWEELYAVIHRNLGLRP